MQTKGTKYNHGESIDNKVSLYMCVYILDVRVSYAPLKDCADVQADTCTGIECL